MASTEHLCFEGATQFVLRGLPGGPGCEGAASAVAGHKDGITLLARITDPSRPVQRALLSPALNVRASTATPRPTVRILCASDLMDDDAQS